jgi:hypothetical protein
MRLGGFEPPTNGLEGRRSSAELQARVGSVAPPCVGLRIAAAADMRGWRLAHALGEPRNPLKVVMAAKRPDFQRLRAPKSAVTIVAAPPP